MNGITLDLDDFENRVVMQHQIDKCIKNKKQALKNLIRRFGAVYYPKIAAEMRVKIDNHNVPEESKNEIIYDTSGVI